MACWRQVALLIAVLIYQSEEYPSNSLKAQCPRLYQKEFKGYIPRGNITAGKYILVFDYCLSHDFT